MSLGQISFGPNWFSRRLTGFMWGLEHAFDAQVGASMEDWESWFEEHPDKAKAAAR